MPITIDPNLKLSPDDPRDYIAKIALVETPVAVDLKPLVVEVEDQYSFNSCTANAGCSALELMFNLNGYKVDLSRMYLYYYSRELSGLKGDQGAYPRSIGEALLKHGTCYESTWGYTSENLETEPGATAILEAENFKILSYERITGDVLPQIKSALAQNIPVLLTMQVHRGMRKLSGPWQSHDWNYNTSMFNSSNGLHEVLVIGYDDRCQRLLVENSWGSNWGDGGFFGLPYAALDVIVPELWVLTPKPATLTYLQTNPPPPVVVDPVIVQPKGNIIPLPFKIFLGVMALVAIITVVTKVLL